MAQELDSDQIRRQMAMVEYKEQLAEELVHNLAINPDLAADVCFWLHEEKLTYKEVVERHLKDEKKPLEELMQSPLVEAYRNIDKCDTVERLLLESNETTREEFLSWVDSEIEFLASGLQHSMSYGLIERVPKSISDEKRKTRYVKWRENNPDEAAKIQIKASKKAAEVAEPYVYTNELRPLINKFLKYMKPEEVVEVLRMMGYSTDYNSLTRAIRTYPDMENSYKERLAEERKVRKETIMNVYIETGSIAKTARLLSPLYTFKQVEHTILRNRKK